MNACWHNHCNKEMHRKTFCRKVGGTGKNRIKKTGGKKGHSRARLESHQVSAGAWRGLLIYVEKRDEWRTDMAAIQNRTT